MNAARVILVLLAVLVCSPSLAEEARYPLNEVPLDFYSLKSWGLKYYDLYHFRKKRFKDSGVAITERDLIKVARTPLETRVIGDTIILRDYWRDQSGTVSRTLVECYCNMDNLLSLQKMVVHYQDETIACDVSDGQYELSFLGKTRGGRWPKDTVIDLALLRVVTMLPRFEGGVYTFSHWSPTPQLNVRPVSRSPIRCEGEAMVNIGGRSMKCTKFVSGNIHTWVREDGVLARVEIPGWKVLELAE